MNLHDYPLTAAFPPDRLKKLVSSKDWDEFRDLLLSRAEFLSIQLITAEDDRRMHAMQGAARESLLLAGLQDYMVQVEQGQMAQDAREQAAKRPKSDMFGEKAQQDPKVRAYFEKS